MKNIKIILASLVLAASVSSCIVDDEVDTGYAESDYIFGFSNPVANESYFADEGVVLAQYPIDLLGGQEGLPVDRDVVISYVIADESTATEGQEFDFVDNSGTITVPAGERFAQFPLNINTGGFDPNVPTTLILRLTSTNTDDSVISSINDELAITFVGCQSQLDEFSYQVTTLRSDGALQNSQIEDITQTSVNNFMTETVGPYGPGAAAGDIGGEPGFNFVDVCGTITIPSQNLVNLYSNQVFGSGSVDADTGVITMTYTITFASGNRMYTGTYTPQ